MAPRPLTWYFLKWSRRWERSSVATSVRRERRFVLSKVDWDRVWNVVRNLRTEEQVGVEDEFRAASDSSRGRKSVRACEVRRRDVQFDTASMVRCSIVLI